MAFWDNPAALYPLFGMAQGLLQAGQPSPYRTSLGGALGQGFGGMLQGLQAQQQAEMSQEMLAERKRANKAKRDEENLRRQIFGLAPLPEEEEQQSAPFGAGIFGNLFGSNEPAKAPQVGPQPTSPLAQQGASAAGVPFGAPTAAGGASPLAGLAAKYGLSPQQFYGIATTMPEMLQALAPEEGDLRAVGGALVRVNPDGTVTELYKAPKEGAGPQPQKVWDPKTNTYTYGFPQAGAPAGPGEMPSVADVVAPIYAKIAKGEAITAGERAALDEYQRASITDQLTRGLFGDTQPTTPVTPTPEAPAAAPAPTVTPPAEVPQISDTPEGKAIYDLLPSGAHYIAPDGQERVKP